MCAGRKGLRGGPSGLIIKGGKIAAEWGEPDRPDMTFSIAKSYLSILTGVAVTDGLIGDLDEPIGDAVPGDLFAGAHNGAITWRHLLTQTSEWEGELFGLPDWIDRGRQVNSTPGMEAGTIGGSAAASDNHRDLQAPGTFWEYNDVRVNRASLSLLRLYGAPLPQILKSRIMDPIGASQTWDWHGYETSWVEEKGQRVQSVSGGAHWGGGVWIDSYDHARFGLLFLRGGRWRDAQILSENWIAQTTVPCDINPEYGLLWWLNHQHSMSDLACEKSFAARGAGGNIIFIEPEKDIIIVLRWCGNPKGVIDRILGSAV